MEKTEFIEVMKAEAEKRGEVVVQTINRTDNSYTGLCIKAEAGVPTPIVNIDYAYEKLILGMWDIDKCLEYLNDILNMKPDTPTNDILEWEKAKKMLFLRPFRRVEDAPFERVENFFLVPYLQLDDKACSVARITTGLMDHWEIDEETLFAAAKENQEKLRPVKIYSMEEKYGLPTPFPLYIVTVTNEHFGAGAIFYNGVEEKLRELMGGNFYVIPSSIHEVVIIPKTFTDDTSALVGMVKLVNAESVGEQDRLSDTVYEFVDGKFKIAE